MNSNEGALEKASLYAAVWSSNDPDKVAEHYAQDGIACLNAGEPIRGRTAIAKEYAAPFFRDSPNSIVLMHDFRLAGQHGLFTGLLVAPSHQGKSHAHLLGWEEGTLDSDGFILSSQVWFDRDEYIRLAE